MMAQVRCEPVSEGRHAWHRMAGRVEQVRDKLGKCVDPGIRNTVIVLNLLGIATRQSCEGHVNAGGHGLAAPWVEFLDASRDRLVIRAWLDSFYSDNEFVAPDIRLEIEEDRLSNGGGYSALQVVRESLAAGRLLALEINGLRGRLVLRQAEMARFTTFLRGAWAAQRDLLIESAGSAGA